MPRVILINRSSARLLRLRVPANRSGYGCFTAARPKTFQDLVGLITYAIFSTLHRREPPG